jgi:hypothetical protein
LIGVFGLVVMLCIAAGRGGDDDSKRTTQAASSSARSPTPVSSVAGTPVTLDNEMVFNSVSAAFVKQYRQAHGYAVKVDASAAFCKDEKGGAFDCELDAKLGLGIKELWGYRAKATGRPGCWVAETYKPFGAYQDDVDSYRNRDFLAPSRSEVRKDIRIARKMRHLSGCAANLPTARTSNANADRIAQLSAQNVSREFPGEQDATSCRYRGKDEVALAPDSYEYTCKTTLPSGRKYVDKISCFDKPPYDDFDSCTSHDGYPDRPPRALPG